MGLKGVMSHFSVHIRAAWLNYILTGTWLHRFHHSADPVEGRNYAVTMSLLDVLFGTFSYAPDRLPTRLGIKEPMLYPKSSQFWRVMMIPLRRAA